MLTALTTIREKFSARKAATLSSYHQVVKALGEGEQVDPDNVAEVLDRAGIDPGKLEEDLQLYAKRQNDLLNLEQARTAAKQLPDVQERIKRLSAELKKVADPIRKQIVDANAELAELQRISGNESTSLHQLRHTCPVSFDDEVKQVGEESRGIAKRLEYLAEREATLTGRISTLHDEVKELERNIARGRTDFRDETLTQMKIDLPRKREQLEALREELAGIPGETKKLQQQQLQLNEKASRIHDRKLETWPTLTD